MSAFGTYLLAAAAFVGTVMFFADPSMRLLKWSRGKKKSDLKAKIEEKIENDFGNTVVAGCGYVIFLFMSLVYTFIVEPLAAISALVYKIGYQPVAYAMLAIVALAWIILVRGFVLNRKKETASGDEEDEVLKVGNPFWVTVRRYFFFLPDLYLWYMFLVVIGTIK